MTRMTAVLVFPVVALLGGTPGLAAAQEMPPMPKPGPEHAVLSADAGTWDAKVEMMTPGGPMTSSGVETNRMSCAGLCLVTEFKGEMMPGVAFEGNGVTAYDPKRQKYIGSWTDSMSQGLMVSESTWDPAAKTMTAMIESPDMTGAIVKMKAVTEQKGDTRVFTMYNPDGQPGMRITYTRKK